MKFCTRAVALATAALILFASLPDTAQARGDLLASRTLSSWDGPETKGYCGKMATMTGIKCRKFKCRKTTWKTCVHPKVDLKRHQIVARMYGPDTIPNADSQLKTIADACLVAGLVLGGIPAVITAPLGNTSVELFKTGVEACLKTQNVLSQLLAPGFEVNISEIEFFEH
jgi:hypothetical protein